MKKNFLLITAFILLFALPFVGSYIKWGGPPPGFGDFPAQHVVATPELNLPYFIFACTSSSLMLVFLFFPTLFGFKKAIPPSLATEKAKIQHSHLFVSVQRSPAHESATKTKHDTQSSYPTWFKPSLIILILSWFFMWKGFESIQFVSYYTFVPLWWSFIFVLDGLVYKRNNGISLVSSKPDTMKLLAIVSCFSWFVFEFQNYFVIENWYYPNNKIFSNFGNISWQLLSYTTVLPAIFEWYHLLCTFKKLKQKYEFGPKISLSRSMQIAALAVGLTFSFLMGLYPFTLFWMLWVSLIPVLVPAMVLSGYWTPFKPISKKGDYSSVVLIAIATLLNGFFWELWNFGSAYFHPHQATNPNFWKYSVPYLDKYHFFSEMPILGYFGYLYFGIGCWVLWLAMGYIFGFKTELSLDKVKSS